MKFISKSKIAKMHNTNKKMQKEIDNVVLYSTCKNVKPASIEELHAANEKIQEQMNKIMLEE